MEQSELILSTLLQINKNQGETSASIKTIKEDICRYTADATLKLEGLSVKVDNLESKLNKRIDESEEKICHVEKHTLFWKATCATIVSVFAVFQIYSRYAIEIANFFKAGG